MNTNAHTQLRSELYGHIVKLQVFRRNREEPDQIIEDSLETYLGKLVGYSTSKNGVTIWLENVGVVQVTDKRQYLEVFDRDDELIKNNYAKVVNHG